MRVSPSYDAGADTAYIRFGDERGVVRSVSPVEDLVLDFDADGQLVGIEFVTASALLDEETLLDAEQDELLGITQIAELLGKPKQNVAQHYTRRPEFPAPAAELPAGRYWRRGDVERWKAERELSTATKGASPADRSGAAASPSRKGSKSPRTLPNRSG